MQFVGCAYQEYRGIVRLAKAGVIAFFPVVPVLFVPRVHGQRVGASFDDRGDAVTKTAANLLQLFRSPAIFYCVVKDRGYCFVFICTMLQDEAGDSQKMTHVRYFCALTPLLAVELVGVREGIAKALG